MKFFVTLILFLYHILILSQDKIKIYDGIHNDTISYFSEDNKIFKCYYSRNINTVDKCKTREELLPKTKEYKSWIKFFSKSPIYDRNYAYDLPYQKGQEFKILQGYYGDFSHHNTNAIDFEMAEGTEILAVREGIVVQVIQNNNKGCPSEECAKYGNYISILHSDKTRAEYWHLKYKGSVVQVGNKVKKGDLIGYSGNTGWTNGPHLHFVCYSPSYMGMKKQETVKTLFKTGDGSRIEYLNEGKSYLKKY
ncbi:M23 family metallopeptidase [Chryseobacterium wangxinyae]|uniref:M23 family metallopeptidase n=1 Tax=Chryseobacterium sp. CY353 TaxID=2997334 RepID=UPI00226F87D6|nr:M23 family metallopeptidase [Chryseobacterium sp. CY353]MCY0968745.1 M23 family metallopeptidase [Chryseobacterium sp. CY353]